MTNANLENHTGKVTLDELRLMSAYISDAISKMQSHFNDETGHVADWDASGFTIGFNLEDKHFALRCELSPTEVLPGWNYHSPSIT